MRKALAAAKLRGILAAFDAEVADELSREGERADLWSEIEVPVELLRIVLGQRTSDGSAPAPSSPSPDSRRDVLTGIVLDQCKAMQGDDFAALVEGVVRDLVAALKAAEAERDEALEGKHNFAAEVSKLRAVIGDGWPKEKSWQARAEQAEADLAAARAEIDRLREGLRSTETPLTHASQCLDGIVSMDEEDEGENGGSATCQAVKKVVDRALKRIRALDQAGKATT